MTGTRGRSLSERFWSFVDKSDAGGCWVWTGARLTAGGYGAINSGNRLCRAHRLAWEFAHGPIEPGLFVCHRCDNPPCVRVDHLFLGTPAENIADMFRKGRARRAQGAAAPTAKLSPRQVEELRFIRSGLGHSYRELGRAYGISADAVRALCIGKTWRSVL